LRQTVWRVLPVMAALPTFWALYDQQGSSWTVQAQQMASFLEPEQMGVVNPILIMLLIPAFDKRLYPWCERKGYKVRERRASLTALAAHETPPDGGRHAVHGRRLRGGGLGAAAHPRGRLRGLHVVAAPADPPHVHRRNPGLSPLASLTAAAASQVSITGLEFAYSEATPSLKSSMMSLFLATTAVGDLLTGAVYSSFARLPRAAMFFLFAGFMLLTFAAFCVVARRFVSSAAPPSRRLPGAACAARRPTPVSQARSRTASTRRWTWSGTAARSATSSTRGRAAPPSRYRRLSSSDTRRPPQRKKDKKDYAPPDL
jgi:POT family proton-dependent oligopeptide transporter